MVMYGNYLYVGTRNYGTGAELWQLSTVISVTPTSENYGDVKVKKSESASFTVGNSGKTNITISTSITGQYAPMFTITSGSGSKTIKPHKTVTIKVAFKPTSKESMSATLVITSNDPVTPEVDIPLTGTGE